MAIGDAVLWTFGIIVSIIATVMVSRYFFQASQPILRMSVDFRGGGALFNASKGAKRDLSVSYKGQSVSYLGKNSILLANTGSITIKKPKAPIRISLPNDLKIFEFDFTSNRDDSDRIYKITRDVGRDNQSLLVYFEFMNPNDWVKITIIGDKGYTDIKNNLEVKATIPGLTDQLNINDFDFSWYRKPRIKTDLSGFYGMWGGSALAIVASLLFGLTPFEKVMHEGGLPSYLSGDSFVNRYLITTSAYFLLLASTIFAITAIVLMIMSFRGIKMPERRPFINEPSITNKMERFKFMDMGDVVYINGEFHDDHYLLST